MSYQCMAVSHAQVAANNRDIVNDEIDAAACGRLPGLRTAAAKSARDLKVAIAAATRKCEGLQVGAATFSVRRCLLLAVLTRNIRLGRHR